MFYFPLSHKFQLDICNGCHKVLVKAINLNNIAFSNIPRFDYRCVIKGISKSKVVNSLPKSELNGKMEHCKVQFFLTCLRR